MRKVIGLCGDMGSGKDTAAAGLMRSGWVRVSLADPIRDMLVAMNPLVGKSLDGVLGLGAGEVLRLIPVVAKLGWDEAKRQYPEVRSLLQKLGTEAGRGVLGDDIWIEQAVKKIESFSNHVVITDVRFDNEIELIHDLGGMLIRIERPGLKNNKVAMSHASENSILGQEDMTLVNDGSEEQLQDYLMELVDASDFWDTNYESHVREKLDGLGDL